MHAIKLEIFSDVICPWCYLGKRRLESALKRLPADVQLHTKWRAFELNPKMPPEGVERREYRIGKFGSWKRSQELDQQVTAAGAEVGISFNFAGIERTPNSFDCHRVIWLAEQVKLQDQVVEALFKAYFVEGWDLSRQQVQVDIASAAGLAEERIQRLLTSDEGTRAVKAEEQAAKQLGIDGVPFFIFDDRFGLSGAQPEDVFLRAIRATIEQRPVALARENATGCSLDRNGSDQASC